MVEDVKAFHAAILQFLLSKFPKTAQAFSSESGVTGVDVTGTLKTEDLLQKKWLATSKLQVSLMAHEKQIAAKDLKLGVLEGLYGLGKAQDIRFPSSVKSRAEITKMRKADIVCASSQAPSIVIASQNSNQVDVWNFNALNEPVLSHNLKASGNVLTMAFDPLGYMLLIASGATTIEVLKVQNWTTLHKLRAAGTTILSLHTYPQHISNPFKHHTGFNTVLVMRDLAVQLWDVVKGSCIKTTSATSIKAHYKASCLVGTKYLCIGLDDGKVTTFLLQDDDIQPGSEFQAHDRSIEALVTIDVEEGKKHRFASSGRDSTIKIWDAATHTCLYQLKGHHDWVRHLTLHPLGRVLASAGDDRSLRFWDVDNGTLIKEIIEAHPLGVTGFSFISTGVQLCSFSDKIPMMIWSCDQSISALSNASTELSPISSTRESKSSSVIAPTETSPAGSVVGSTAYTSKEDLKGVTESTRQNAVTPQTLASALAASPAAASVEKTKSTSSLKKSAPTAATTQRKKTGHKGSAEAATSPGASRTSSREAIAAKPSSLMSSESSLNPPPTGGSDKRQLLTSADLKLKHKGAPTLVRESSLRRLESSRGPEAIQSARGLPKTSQVSPRGPNTARRESLPMNSSLGLRRSSTISSIQRMPTIKVQETVSRATPDTSAPEASLGVEVPRPEPVRPSALTTAPVPIAQTSVDRASHSTLNRSTQMTIDSQAPKERPSTAAQDVENVPGTSGKEVDLLEVPAPGRLPPSSQESVAQEVTTIGPTSAVELHKTQSVGHHNHQHTAAKKEAVSEIAVEKPSRGSESTGSAENSNLLIPTNTVHRKEATSATRNAVPSFASATSRPSPGVMSKQSSASATSATQAKPLGSTKTAPTGQKQSNNVGSAPASTKQTASSGTTTAHPKPTSSTTATNSTLTSKRPQKSAVASTATATSKTSTNQGTQSRHTLPDASTHSGKQSAVSTTQAAKATTQKNTSVIPERPQVTPAAGTPATQAAQSTAVPQAASTSAQGSPTTSNKLVISSGIPTKAAPSGHQTQSAKTFSGTTHKSSPKAKTNTVKTSPTHAPSSKTSNFAAPSRPSGGRVSPGKRTNANSSTRTGATPAKPSTNSTVKAPASAVASKV